MMPWRDRPIEVAALLNPAFCAVLLNRAVQSYNDSAQRGLPYPFVFLVLPMTLHRPTREAFPRSVATRMHAWLQTHPEVRVNFAERAAALVPVTKEALSFGLHEQWIAVRDDGTVVSGHNGRLPPTWQGDEDLRGSWQAASLLGRWLHSAGTVSTVYMMWGIRP